MKNIKRILALVLALTMVLSMSAFVFADEGGTTNPGSITIKSSVAGKDYDFYRIFDLTGSNEKDGVYGNVAYTIADKWAGFFADGAAGAAYIVAENSGDLNPISIGTATKYINITEENVADVAQAALDYAAKNNIELDKNVQGNGNNLTVNDLPLGYYLVYPRGAANIKANYSSICSLTSTVPAAEINIKAEYPAIIKEITEADADPTDVNEAAIGDSIPYTMTTKIPDMTGYTKYFFVAHDTLSDGLTLNNEIVSGKNTGFNVKIGDTVLTEGEDYDVDIAEDGQSFRIIFKNMVSRTADVGKTVTIEYSATLNEKAVVNAPNTNTATIEYSNDPNVKPTYEPGEEPENPDDPEDPKYKFMKDGKEVDPTGESAESETETYTTSLTLQKVDENGNVLTGAEFQLTGDALNEVRVTTSVSFVEIAEGETGFDGPYYLLNNGTYTKEAPTQTGVEENADGAYVVLEDGYELHVGQETFTVGGVTYRALEETETTTAQRYTKIEGNADKYDEAGKHYKKVVETEIQADDAETEAIEPIKAFVDETTGLLTFEGLKSGSYTLTETTTPKGYNTINPITFTVSFDAASKTFSSTNINLELTEIVNKSGHELPETGGIGTTIFYILGSILLAGAAVLLITKKRMSADA